MGQVVRLDAYRRKPSRRSVDRTRGGRQQAAEGSRIDELVVLLRRAQQGQ